MITAYIALTAVVFLALGGFSAAIRTQKKDLDLVTWLLFGLGAFGIYALIVGK